MALPPDSGLFGPKLSGNKYLGMGKPCDLLQQLQTTETTVFSSKMGKVPERDNLRKTDLKFLYSIVSVLEGLPSVSQEFNTFNTQCFTCAICVMYY